MRRILNFWCECASIAWRGSSSFANDWQWVFGVPLLSAALAGAAASRDAPAVTTGEPIIDAFLAALFAFVITFAFRFAAKLTAAPVHLREVERARIREGDSEISRLRDRMAPRINVFLNKANLGVLQIDTELQNNGVVLGRGPSSKWVQFCVSSATDAQLVNCEARLTSFRRLNEDGTSVELEPEHIHCGWSMRESLKETIPASIEQHANLLTLYSNSRFVAPQVSPVHIALRDGIQAPGRFRVKVVVTADGAPSKRAEFVVEHNGFSHVSIVQAL